LGAQSAICSGGRYDGLCEQLGGKPTPGCGFGIGVERTLLLLEGMPANDRCRADAYVVHQGTAAAPVAFAAAESLRDRDLAITLDCSGASFKSQMKKADASGAHYAVIIGDDEVAASRVTVKPLREQAEQISCTIQAAADMIRKGGG
jgi:histidyl-tRNA synthetase